MNNSLLLISVTVALVALVDFIPRAVIKVKKPIKVRASRSKIPPYLIMPTVYGDISYLKNITFLKKYRNRVVICTSIYESKEFYKELRKICRNNSFRYIKAEVPVVKGVPVKNAYTIYSGVFKKSSNLKVNNSQACILIDADTFSRQNVNDLVRTFTAANLQIASLRCEAARAESVIEILQAFEYKVAMDNRSMDPWLTSGACNMATVKTYKKIFKLHSQFFAGGDIEIGKIASVMGLRVGHINFTFLTELPDTLKGWYQQRIIWFAGGFRHHVVNIGSFGWFHFFMLFYNSALVYLLFPLRWVELINYPATLLLMLGISWFYTFVLLAGRDWRKEYLLLPFYSFVQTMWVVPRGFIEYCRFAWRQRSFGFLSYDLMHKSKKTRHIFAGLNFASAAIVVIAVLSFSFVRIEYWMNNPRGYLTQALHSISEQ